MALCAGLGWLACASAAAEDTAVSKKSLKGTWRGVRYSEGKGEDPSQGVKLELSFDGNKVVGKRGADAIGEGTFKLSEDGKTIDATGSTGGFKGKTYLGILKIDGDTLYWCTGTAGKLQKRPTKFEADSGSQHYLIIVKKEK
jgi:uncharacterized protein (TIGR03067 family)